MASLVPGTFEKGKCLWTGFHPSSIDSLHIKLTWQLGGNMKSFHKSNHKPIASEISLAFGSTKAKPNSVNKLSLVICYFSFPGEESERPTNRISIVGLWRASSWESSHREQQWGEPVLHHDLGNGNISRYECSQGSDGWYTLLHCAVQSSQVTFKWKKSEQTQNPS